MLIDAHQHVGDCRVFDVDIAEETVLAALDDYELDHALVMPFPGARDPAAVHDRIAAMTAATGGRVRGIVNLTPHQARSAYAAEAERCVSELGFVALKLHTLGHAVEPGSADGQMVFAEAARLAVPVMIHTGGAGVPFASPTHALPLARQWAQVPVVLAHAGMGVATREAAIVAELCPNVYLETSWCGTLDTAMLAKAIGPERMMLGSDGPVNLGVEIAKHRALGLGPAALGQCLGGTAAQVFRL
ncbi:MAG: amidohydrolase family protein [Streptosporangiaceae bacterium]